MDRGQQPLLGTDTVIPMGLVQIDVNAVDIPTSVARIDIRTDAKPRFCKPRKIPFTLEPVKKELGRLEDMGFVAR